MATLDEVLKELSEEKADVIRTAIEAERQKGISESQKKSGEIKKRMTNENVLRDYYKELGVDPDADMAEQIAILKSKLSAASKGENEKISQLEKAIATLTKKNAEAEQLAEQRRIKFSNAKITEVLTKKIGEKIYASEYVIPNLISSGSVKLTDDEQSVVFINNGLPVELDSGIDGFLKANPGIVRNTQRPGSGGAPGSGDPGKKQMIQSEWEKLEPKARAEYIKSGGVLT
jgi:hypothetical protein